MGEVPLGEEVAALGVAVLAAALEVGGGRLFARPGGVVAQRDELPEVGTGAGFAGVAGLVPGRVGAGPGALLAVEAVPEARTAGRAVLVAGVAPHADGVGGFDLPRRPAPALFGPGDAGAGDPGVASGREEGEGTTVGFRPWIVANKEVRRHGTPPKFAHTNKPRQHSKTIKRLEEMLGRKLTDAEKAKVRAVRDVYDRDLAGAVGLTAAQLETKDKAYKAAHKNDDKDGGEAQRGLSPHLHTLF